MTDIVSKARSEFVALLVLIFGASVIGFAPILVRLADAGPSAIGMWRFLFAIPLLWIIDIASPTPREHAPGKSAWLLAALAGVLFSGDLTFWHYGIALTSVANATVLSNLAPIFVALVAWLWLGERLGPMFVFGLVIAVGGACTMAAVGAEDGRSGSLAGDLLAAGTAVWYALYFLAVNAARRTMSAPAVMLYSSAVGAPLLFVVALVLGEDILPATLGGWAACAGLGVMHVLGQGAIAWALGRLKPTLASVVNLIQPVVAALAGAWLFQEILTPLQTIAGIGALIGVVIAKLAATPRTQPVMELGDAALEAAPLERKE